MELTIADKALDQFTERHGVYYELSARNSDGEIIAKYTSNLEAQDVAGYGALLDEKIMELALAEAEVEGEDYE